MANKFKHTCINVKTGLVTNTWLSDSQGTSYYEKGFGKPARWVSEDRIVAENEDIALSDQFMVEPIMGQDIKLYHFPTEYTIETVDITAEVAAAKKLSDRSRKRAFGEALIDKISTINDGKNLSVEQVDAFMSNALITSLREHLWAGNISTFISKLESSDVSAFFSAPEKTAVLAECAAFLTSLEG